MLIEHSPTYPRVTNPFAMLFLLLMSDRDEDVDQAVLTRCVSCVETSVSRLTRHLISGRWCRQVASRGTVVLVDQAAEELGPADAALQGDHCGWLPGLHGLGRPLLK